MGGVDGEGVRDVAGKEVIGEDGEGVRDDGSFERFCGDPSSCDMEPT